MHSVKVNLKENETILLACHVCLILWTELRNFLSHLVMNCTEEMEIAWRI